MHGGFVLARFAALKTGLNPWHGQALLLQMPVSSFEAVSHQCTGDEETHLLEGADKGKKHCVMRVISVWKPFLVHAESSSSISASCPITHYHVC